MGGQLETLIWLVNKGWKLTAYTSRTAVNEGHLHILQYLHDNHCSFDEEACSRAIHNNHSSKGMDILCVNVCDFPPEVEKLVGFGGEATI